MGAVLLTVHMVKLNQAVFEAEFPGSAPFTAQQRADLIEGFTHENALPTDAWIGLGLLLLSAGGLLAPLFHRRRWPEVDESWQPTHVSLIVATAGWTLLVLLGLYGWENWLLHLLAGTVDDPVSWQRHLTMLQGVAFPRLVLMPLATLVVVTTALVISTRRFRKPSRTLPAESIGSAVQQDGDAGAYEHWRSSRQSPRRPAGSPPGGRGIALSGGGIRSATFCLGALQALQNRPGELTGADYLTAVSGGAYAAGAIQLARQGLPADAAGYDAYRGVESVEPPDGSTFSEGSPEFDYLRRHSSYLADTVREWAAAVFTLMRGVLISVLFLGLLAVLAGRWVGHIYQRSGFLGGEKSSMPWHPLWGPVLAVVAVAAGGALLELLSLSRWSRRRDDTDCSSPSGPSTPGAVVPLGRVARRKRQVRHGTPQILVGIVSVMVVFGAVIPLVVWAGDHITTGGLSSARPAVAGGAVTAAAGVATTVLGLWSRHRTEIETALHGARRRARHQRLGDTGKRIAQWLSVYGGIALVAGVYLLVFGIVVRETARHQVTDSIHWSWGVPKVTLPGDQITFTIALTCLFLILYGIIDETALGLHPFYRRRLSKAFAVRRVRWNAPRDGRDAGDRLEPDIRYEAQPYDHDEVTRLENYGEPRSAFPRVIFCAAAHSSDPDDVPPGRKALPFTISGDWIGGPELGWYTPAEIRDCISPRLQVDLTVQTAMAVSGAAFASAMGRYHHPANVVLALTNARLGTWMPNPRVVWEMRYAGRRWWQPRFPRWRRLSYLLRELFGRYPKDDPLVFVADGGHYEDLGLIELLRHGCTEIYCFDATSPQSSFAASLASSVTLAREELGVVIKLDRPERAQPAGGERQEAATVQARTAESCIVTGQIRYPGPRGAGTGPTGRLVIGKSVLTAQTPWEVRQHAEQHALFPHDATGDQWFDVAKFDAYTALGRYVGDQAFQQMDQLRRKSHVAARPVPTRSATAPVAGPPAGEPAGPAPSGPDSPDGRER
ncbi:hypothetical protein [Actinoplanes awajinensis]|uniref:hypothetical protein n=1 Tax=Actinoplanes awajinensis TaxID=135946 RepID=UPI001E3BB2CE|nr:hypothetical protein [Actinoplanes awajinensis]